MTLVGEDPVFFDPSDVRLWIVRTTMTSIFHSQLCLVSLFCLCLPCVLVCRCLVRSPFPSLSGHMPLLHPCRNARRRVRHTRSFRDTDRRVHPATSRLLDVRAAFHFLLFAPSCKLNRDM